MIYQSDRLPLEICLGRAGENNVNVISFDMTPIISVHSVKSVQILAQRPGEDFSYPVTTAFIEPILHWTVSSADTVNEGIGRAEIVAITEDGTKLSAITKTKILPSLYADQTADPPPVLKPWLDNTLQDISDLTNSAAIAAEEAKTNADLIIGMKVESTTLAPGSDATVKWDGSSGLLSFGIPKGQQGKTGPKGEQGGQGPKGEPGLNAPQIDDAAESTDNPWSGDKVAKEIDAAKLAMMDTIFDIILDRGQNYAKAMSAYFQSSGAERMEDLTDMVESWYKLGRSGWTGGTRFDSPDKSTASTGRKIGDNAGLVCEPSINTVRGRDDYATLPLFAVTDCNWELDAEGKRHITAIKGIPSAKPFVTDDPSRPVGVLQMAPWCRYMEDANGYEYWFTDQMNTNGYYPIPESVDLDGTIHSWVVHAKYGMGDAYSSIAGVPIRVWDVSHNSQLTEIPEAFGGSKRYCGKCACDDAWIKLHVYIKYASLTLDGIMNGCCRYYRDKHPAVAETGVKRIIVTVDEGNNLLVGSTICLGTATYGDKTTQGSVVDRARISRIEDITLGGTAYKAVYLDVSKPFDTTTGLAWTTMQWWTGSTDAVLGNDGSPYSGTSSMEPYKLQGIEHGYGCYEVMADTILAYADEGGANVLTANVCRNAAQFASSVTTAYKQAAYSLACPEKIGWNWLKKLGHDAAIPEAMFGCLGGGSSSAHAKDAVFQYNASSGLFEWLSVSRLDGGPAASGLSCAAANFGLGGTYWFIGGRLSANGSRGEYAR